MKSKLIIMAGLVSLPLVLAVCLALGSTNIGPGDLNTDLGRAILSLRLTRVLTGFLVGASLACAGAVLQGLLRNPLAEPYILGVSGGAALGAALAILGGWAGLMLPSCAFAGGLAALALVYGLAQQNGVPSVYGLLLSGAIINALCSSLLMLIISTINVEGLHSITWWMLGNLQGPSKPLLKAGWAINALGMIGLWLMAREFNALTLGRDMAHHLGVRTGRVVLLGMALSALLAAVGVAMAGLIGFVGLIVPHQVRNWVGPDLRRLIPLSALAGGMFLVICDTLARVVFAPVEIPVGVITALLGGPFFLVLLRRRRKSGWLE